MKYWFICVLVALMVAGTQAGEEGKSEGKKKAGGFAAVDTNEDGKISKKEYVAFQKKKAKKADKEFDRALAEGEFEFKDQDGDGFLSKSEMAAKGKKKKIESEESSAGDQE